MCLTVWVLLFLVCALNTLILTTHMRMKKESSNTIGVYEMKTDYKNLHRLLKVCAQLSEKITDGRMYEINTALIQEFNEALLAVQTDHDGMVAEMIEENKLIGL